MMGSGGLAIDGNAPKATPPANPAPNAPDQNATQTPASTTPTSNAPTPSRTSSTASRANFKPEVGLEFKNMKIKFLVVGQQDLPISNEDFELFPSLDSSAPSIRSLNMQKRLLKRSQAGQDNTLSGYIGSSTSDRSGDNQSVTSSNDNSENSSDKKSNNTNGSGDERPVRHCPICKKTFTKASALKKHVNSHSGSKPNKCTICKLSKFSQNLIFRIILFCARFV